MRCVIFVLSCFFCFSSCESPRDFSSYIDYGYSPKPNRQPTSQYGYSPKPNRQPPQPNRQPSQPNRQPPQPNQQPFQTVLVQRDCCGCSSGGSLVELPISQEASHYSQLDTSCRLNPIYCRGWVLCNKWKEQCSASRCSARVLQQIQN